MKDAVHQAGALHGSADLPGNKFRSDAFEAIHASASALFTLGVINKGDFRDFEERCLIISSATPDP